MKTKDRIIHGALTLFNKNGERSVTTNHIAAHLEISPGNLYYHFRNKEEIISGIFDNYAKELKTRFQPMAEDQQSNMPSVQVMLSYLDSIFELMWNYRFFYANLPDILSRDDALKLKYTKAQQALNENLIAIMHSFRDSGLIDLEDDELQALTKTLHLVASCWINYQTALLSDNEITEAVIYQGMLQMLNVVRPMATEQGRKQILELEEHYKGRL
ncbi:TetR/AcrR family transcriptional regulator [Aliivibrio fischeri]|uniref:TetR/AcrR family transcriptional regulator n=1 Tax=Aliivibrio fischeri TaxID=668 RepID=UPI0012DA89DF|nr:TetR/AcrR family transcriptional regulator [Aliivibrio fischeri]MUJ37299.1 TetR family transcriptional regulator [Aliivibrio fischeri]